jgi:hypothetical protein
VVSRLLESGKNVVTPLGWFYPPDDERSRFDAVCRAAGVTLHGTGIHPGGITERFPLVISALSGAVRHVRAEEFSDIRTYGAPDVIRDWMLFGTTPEQARTSIMADALGGGFRQSVWMLAAELGFDLDPHLRSSHDVAVATAPIDSPIGPIAPGLVAAQRFRWEGLVDGEPVISAAVNWLMGERNPGIVATALHCVNAVPYVVAARPGLLTYLDLPPVAGRAAADLHRDRRDDAGPGDRPGPRSKRLAGAYFATYGAPPRLNAPKRPHRPGGRGRPRCRPPRPWSRGVQALRFFRHRLRPCLLGC